MTTDTVLTIVALIAFGLAALNVVVHPQVNLIAIGLFCWVLTALI